MTNNLTETINDILKDVPKDLNTSNDFIPRSEASSRLRRLSLLMEEFRWFLDEVEIFEIDNDAMYLKLYECDCGRCRHCKKDLPHFVFKPLNFKYDWYKHPGRGDEFSRELSEEELIQIQQAMIDFKKELF